MDYKQLSQTMKLFGGKKKIIEKTKIGENIHSLELVEAVLVKYNLLDNQYQQKWYTILLQKNLILIC